MSKPDHKTLLQELDLALENGVGRAILTPSLESAESLRRLMYRLRSESPKAELYKRLRFSISPLAVPGDHAELWIVVRPEWEEPSDQSE